MDSTFVGKCLSLGRAGKGVLSDLGVSNQGYGERQKGDSTIVD